MRRRCRGQSMPMALLLVLLLMAVAAVATDVTALLETRQRGYRLAADAALQGTRAGVDYSAYVGGGEIWLDAEVAEQEALRVVQTALLTQGVAGYQVQVRVLPAPTGGEIANFPPHAAAQQVGGTTWRLPAPSVGVYLELPVATLFLDVLLGTPTRVHVFAAASVAQAS